MTLPLRFAERYKLSAFVFCIFLFFFPEFSSITRSYNRIVVEHDFNFVEDKSQFVYVSFEENRVLCARRFRSSPRFTAVVPILRISKAIPWFISLALSLSPFSLQPPRRFSVVLSPHFPRASARRLLQCAFALEVISKNFWRWIVPRDGNRGPTLPAAFTQTTRETTFPLVRATALRLTISERNNTQDSRDFLCNESARASSTQPRLETN